MKVRRYSRLHHNHAGVVSLSAAGTEVAITFDKTLSLDKDYQVELLHLSKILCQRSIEECHPEHLCTNAADKASYNAPVRTLEPKGGAAGGGAPAQGA